jgi:ferredoxin
VSDSPPPRRLVIEVDWGRCIGAATCVSCAPAVFRLNANRIAEVIDPAAADEATILAAARSCPVDAIYVETEAGEILWP